MKFVKTKLFPVHTAIYTANTDRNINHDTDIDRKIFSYVFLFKWTLSFLTVLIAKMPIIIKNTYLAKYQQQTTKRWKKGKN